MVALELGGIMFVHPGRGFLDQPVVSVADLRPGDFCVFGAGYGTPYSSKGEVRYDLTTRSADAPSAVRRAINQTSTDITHFDFDLGGPLLPDARRVVDLGDIADGGAEANRAAIKSAVKDVLARRAVPVMIGGDDSVPIPFLAAFAGQGPVDILQIDAHIDWRDSIAGERLGYSSTMRRAAELPFVRSITQIGMRGVGSARPEDVATAKAWGARLITVSEARHIGFAALAQSLPSDGNLVIQLDADAFDPSVCPAVNAPTPGGFRLEELAELVRLAIAMRGLAGLSVVELVPEQDAYGHSANVVGRLICNAIGSAARRP